jgi:hypothetical protein
MIAKTDTMITIVTGIVGLVGLEDEHVFGVGFDIPEPGGMNPEKQIPVCPSVIPPHMAHIFNARKRGVPT